MNDRLLMETSLLILKSTTEVYVHGTQESSNERTREVLKSGLEETLSAQRETYNLMVERGWYNISNVETTKIKETITKLEQNND